MTRPNDRQLRNRALKSTHTSDALRAASQIQHKDTACVTMATLLERRGMGGYLEAARNDVEIVYAMYLLEIGEVFKRVSLFRDLPRDERIALLATVASIRRRHPLLRITDALDYVAQRATTPDRRKLVRDLSDEYQHEEQRYYDDLEAEERRDQEYEEHAHYIRYAL